MSGFADHAMAAAYCDLVADYVSIVRGAGVRVVETEVVLLDRVDRPPVVYLVQPLVPDLGNQLLHKATDAELGEAIHAVMDRVLALLSRTDEPEVAIDAQLSNWSFADAGDPVLIDVGTPFIRQTGGYVFDQEILLSRDPAWHPRLLPAQGQRGGVHGRLLRSAACCGGPIGELHQGGGDRPSA